MTFPDELSERDELDHRLEAALSRLTEPGHGAARAWGPVTTPTRAAARTRWGATAAILTIGITVGSLLFLQTPWANPAASPGPVAGRTVGPPASSRGAGADDGPPVVDVGRWIDDAWPSIIEGPFGTLDATGYRDDPGTTLGHMPSVDGGPFIERFFGGPATETYQALDGPQDLADRAQIVVRGRPLAFSRPYFNATDGAFWLPELVGARDGILPTSDLRRDVLFRVDEVLGTTLDGGFEPGLVQFTVRAGQVTVDVPSDVPYAAGYGDVLRAGRYLVREAPGADLGMGDDVVLFLRYGEWLGLYDGDFGAVRTLMPVHGLYYAFAIEGDRSRNLTVNPVGDPWRPSIADLRRMAGTLTPEAGQIRPDARIHPARPTHDSSEQPLPSPTPCPPRLVGGSQPRYLSLAALLADSDLVVVARSTTRATTIASGDGGPFVSLANDILVEEVIRGDAAVGSLLPVLRLADADPACPLVVAGVAPLEIDRPYLMALRRDGQAFVLPEAPQALAVVRAGVLSSTRWPELDGLTIGAARELVARAEATEGPASNDAVDALVADLLQAGAPVILGGTFNTMPLGGRGVALCVAGNKVRLNVFDSADEAARVAGSIDPTDPSRVGSASVAWQGDPRFWQRDRLLVLYLGADRATERILIDVLGSPFAAGRGRQADPSTDAC